jgi:glycosyltransferase involved in cell wall biosynthesis
VKILQVIPYFFPAWRFGGPVRVAYDVSRKLIERGHSVTVFTTDILGKQTRVKSSQANIDGVKVFYFRNLSLYAADKKIFITPSLISCLKENINNFDVVHIHGNRTAQSPILHYFLKKNSIPYIVQAHGGLPNTSNYGFHQLYQLLFGSALLKDASKVISITKRESQQYLSLGVPKEKIELVPNSVDLRDYINLPPKGSFKRAFHIQDKRKIILYLGRVHSRVS